MEKSVYIIGEIGQNHNGSLDLAKLLIEVASRPVMDPLFNRELKKMDAIKLTKRDLTQELSASQMNQEYNSPHSFGNTYGEHRAFLELSDNEHFEAYKYAKLLGMDFVETITAIGAMSLLKLFTPDKLKVASRDLTNIPLLHELASTKIPIIVSTGMAGEEELDEALNVISKYNSNISILHCLSQYPSEYKNVNLNTIKYLQRKYSNYTIGYSDHTIGIATPLAAVAMGAQIIEKHITIDRSMKGTDQACSLGMDGINRMVRDIRNLEESLGNDDFFIDPSVKSAKEKLERSLAVNIQIKKGEILTEDMIHMLSPGTGLKWSERDIIIGKKAKNNIEKDELIKEKDVE